MAVQVKIVTTETSLRATSLRASITNLIAVSKCGTPSEIQTAKNAFDCAIAQFKRSFDGAWCPTTEEV